MREQSVGVLEQNRVSCWLAVTPWYRQKRRQSAGTVAAHIISGVVDPTEQEQEQVGARGQGGGEVLSALSRSLRTESLDHCWIAALIA
ncbi:hypothetical protein BHE74_00043282 [Ensete ventricosum]|nr:hypothetical protein BHE74_00043282 [Ensete ventricosum]